MEKSVTVGGNVVFYDEMRGRKKGFPAVLILPGWGGWNLWYCALMYALVGLGYGVILPDFPGFGKTPARAISLEQWNDWMAEFVEATIGKDKEFVVLSHSASGAIALPYLQQDREDKCIGGIFLDPMLVGNKFQEILWNQIICRYIRFSFPRRYREMSWMRNKTTYANSCQLLRSIGSKEIRLAVPCLVLECSRSLMGILATGPEKLHQCEKQKKQWDHSPHLRNTAVLRARRIHCPPGG